MPKGMTGKKHTAETRAKISATKKRQHIKGIWLGKKLSAEHRKKLSDAKIALYKNGYKNPLLGWKPSQEYKDRQRIIQLALNYHHSEEIRKKISDAVPKSEKHHNWKGGFKSRGKHTLFDPAYVNWRTTVFQRDGYKCRIANDDCDGRMEGHHILNWADYPELRYNINNGITLCHAHHPRGRAKEKRLEPIFQALVSVSKGR